MHSSHGNWENLRLWSTCFCDHCSNPSVWYRRKILYPEVGTAPLPNQDLPEDILQDYAEAREICSRSPRGAAALLRLAIQKLCKHLGQPGKNINSDIAALVQQGLPARVQQALDSVRVVGNNAVHPGKIDLQDNEQTVQSLFGLVNFVAEKMISEPNHIEQLYSSLPERTLKEIEKRDNK
tara:strand:+ start:308 stop:847 length:540 start_codon:yes stop_codon:yes gene_type:complete